MHMASGCATPRSTDADCGQQHCLVTQRCGCYRIAAPTDLAPPRVLEQKLCAAAKLPTLQVSHKQHYTYSGQLQCSAGYSSVGCRWLKIWGMREEQPNVYTRVCRSPESHSQTVFQWYRLSPLNANHRYSCCTDADCSDEHE
jgi:hypothetical protein